MAEEATAPVVADATKTVDESTRPVDAADSAKAAEDKPSDSGDVPADAPAEGTYDQTRHNMTAAN